MIILQYDTIQVVDFSAALPTNENHTNISRIQTTAMYGYPCEINKIQNGRLALN